MAAEPRPARANVAPLLVAGLVGVLIGSLVTHSLLSPGQDLSSSASAAPSAPSSESPSRATEAELRRLADQIAALNAAFESSRKSADAAPAPDAERLAQLAALLSADARSATNSDSSPASGLASIAGLHASVRAEIQAALALDDSRFRDARVALEERLDASHRLWPMNQVLSTYGEPARVTASDLGLALDYVLESPSWSDLSEPPNIRFLIQEGVVAEVQFSVER